MGHSIGFEEFVDDPGPKRITRTSVRRGDEGEETAKASLKRLREKRGKKKEYEREWINRRPVIEMTLTLEK
jgi:hypothetical protein